MNWCISLHWKQLPRRRQEEGETGGEEGKAGGRRWGEREREAGERREGENMETEGRKPRRCPGSAKPGCCVQSPWLSGRPGGRGIDSGDCGGSGQAGWVAVGEWGGGGAGWPESTVKSG